MGTKERGLHSSKSRNTKEEGKISKQKTIDQFRINLYLHNTTKYAQHIDIQIDNMIPQIKPEQQTTNNNNNNKMQNLKIQGTL